MNPPDDLLEAIAKRMGISVADATEIVSMVEGNGATHPESAPQLPKMDSGDTFFFEKEGDETTQTVEITQPTEELPKQNLGRYHNLGSLGIGGMGEVRKVLDPSLNRVVALKVIHPHLMTMPALVNRFVEEAQIQANLQHPNIVPIHEIGRLEDNRPFFTMGLVQDDPYSEQIDAVHKAASATQWHPTPNGTTFRDLIHTFHQVCVTVAFAHAQGVIHRDLKPDNILIGRFGQVLVVDWGLAKFIGASDENESTLEQIDTLRPRVGSNQTQVGSVSGTPAYMSPEQARGEAKKLGPPTDVYALGAILYQILSGNAPFKGSSSAAILEQVRKHGPKDNLVLDKIPPPLRALCQSAMERNQAERTLSAQGLAQGLKDWLEGAEKRDKGLHELENAREVLAEIQRFESQAAAEWQQANALIQSEGAESIAGWKSWNKNKATQVKIRGLRDHHRRALQGALVHAPDLEEAHNALAQLVLVDIIRAHALGDLRAEGVFVQQFTGHLDHLGPLAREKLEAQLDHGRSDPIAGRRMRQGVIVGRHTQRQSIGEHFRSGNRLVTLLGTAGVGKTRLALEVSEDLQDLEHKVIFCDLTEATDELGIARRLARALDVRLRDIDPMAHLCEILSAQRTLLILDNLEQVRATIGPLTQEWINNTEHLLILTTSRVRLMVEAETVVSVQPLALLESVDLFVVRGQSVSPRFALTSANRIQICQIVRQLDGLPLAIELAAARLKLLTLDEIGTHLSNRFGLLRSSGKDARALDTALDWSWSLLEPWAKAALSQASLFHGGFDLAAATGVIQKGEIKDAPEIFDVLGGLVDNSLLRLDHSDSGVRYSLLESIRVYANNKLNDPTEGDPTLWGPKARLSAQQNHAAYFSKFGNPASLRALKGFKSSAQWDGLFLELDNLVAAIDYGTTESAPLCCLAALKVLGMKGPVTLGVDIATQVMKMPDLNRRAYSLLEIERGKCLRISGRMGEARSMVHSLPPMQMAAVEPESETKAEEPEPLSREAGLLEAARLMELGNIEFNESKYVEAEKCFSSALDIFQKHCDRAGEGEAIGSLGIVYQAQGQNDQAGEHYTQAIDIAREIGNKRSEGVNLGNLGNVYGEHGQHDLAAEHYTQALDIAREIGNKCTEGIHLGSLGLLYKNQGQHDLAVEHYTQSIDIAREIGDKRSEGINLGNLGGVYREQKQHERAVEHFTQAIDIAREIGDKLFEGINLNCLGIVYQEQGQHDRAVEYFTQAIQIAKEIGNKRFEGINLGNLGDAFVKIAQLDKAEEAFSKAILMCDEILPPAAGAFRGSLALLLARKNKFDETQTLLEIGESQVATYPLEHAKFLCKKGQVQLLADEPKAAQNALDQAKAIATEHKFGDAGEVVEAIAELTALLGSPDDPDDSDEPAGEEREDALIEAARLMELGNIERAESKYAEAERCYRSALEIFQQHGDRAGEGDAIGMLGTVYREKGQQDRALEHFTLAIDIAKEIGNKSGEGFHLGNLGIVYRAQGQHDRAVEHYTQAIDIAREIGDKHSEGNHLGNLGIVYQEQGQYDRAAAYFIQAIDNGREIGNKRGEGVYLGNLGNVYQLQGQVDRAVEHYTQAIDIAKEIGDKRGEGTFLGNLGNVYQVQGQHDRAVEHYTQAIVIAREIGYKRGEGTFLGNLGDIFVKMEQLSDAEKAFRKAIPILDETFFIAAGAFRGSLALLLAQQDQFDEAQTLLEIGEPQVTTYPLEHAKLLCKKGQVQILAGEPEAAQKSLDQAKAISTEHTFGDDGEVAQAIAELTALLGSPDEPDDPDDSSVEPEGEDREDALIEAERLVELGNIERAESNYAEAGKCYHSALEIFEKHGDRAGEGEAIGYLGNICREQGQHDRAAEYYAQAIDIAKEIGDKRTEGINLGNLGNVYKDQGQQDRAVTHYTQAIDMAKEIGNKRSEGAHLGNLGGVYQEQGLHDRAVETYTQAIGITREIGDKRWEGVHLGNLGAVYQQQGQVDRAASHYTQAIDIAREIGNKRSEGIHLGNLGDMLFQQNRLEEAEDAFRKSIAINDEACLPAAGAFRASLALLLAQQDQIDEAQALLEIGEPLVETYPAENAKFLCKKGQVQFLTGTPEAAKKSLGEANAIAAERKLENDGEVTQAIAELTALLDSSDEPNEPDEEREDALIEAARLLELGNIERAESKYAEAEKCHLRALKLFQQQGDRAGEGEAIGHLGIIYRLQGQFDRAIKHFTQALDIAKKIGNKRNEGIYHGHLGNVYREKGQQHLAVPHYTQALDIAREIGDKRNEGINLGNLGIVYRVQGQHDWAVEHFTQALDIAKEIGNRRNEGINLGNLGTVYQEQGQVDRAVRCYTQALDITREIGDRHTEGTILGNLGNLYRVQGQHNQAVQHYTQAINIAREIGDKTSECIHLGNLGDSQSRQNRLEEAEDAFRKSILIGDEASPVAAGAFRGSLALLLAQQDQIDEAQALLETGEPKVATYPSEYTKFLCKKGQVQLLASEPEAAQKSLDQAKVIVTAHKLRDDGEVTQAIAELTALLDSPDDPDEPDEPDEDREDALIEAARLMELGRLEEAESKYSEAEQYYHSALEIFQKNGDRAGEGEAIGNLGFNYRNQGLNDQAVEHFTQALEIAREIGDKRFEGIHLGNLGGVYKQQGQHDQAVAHYTQAIDIASAIGDKRSEAIHLGNLGDALVKIPRVSDAEKAFRKAILICDGTFPPVATAFRGSLGLLLAQKGQLDEAEALLEIGEQQLATYPNEHAKFLCKKGQILLLAGAPETAQECLDQAKAVVAAHELEKDGEVVKAIADLAALLDSSEYPDEEREDALVEAARLMELGVVERTESNYGEAEHCFLSAIELFQKYNDRAGEGEAIGFIGTCYQQKGDLNRAEALYTQAIDIAQKVGDKAREGHHIGNLGAVYLNKSDLERAVEHCTQAVNIAREIGDKKGEGNQCGNLGIIYLRKGELDRAAEHLTQAIDIAAEFGDKIMGSTHLANLAIIYQQKGELDRAAEHLTQAIDSAREVGDKRSEGIQLGNLGDILVQQNRLDEAENVFRKAIPICDETYPFAAGAFRGSLALLLAQKGQRDEALELLKVGEDQLLKLPAEHAKFLCKKGQIQMMMGSREAAQGSLDQAKAIAIKHQIENDVEVIQTRHALEALLHSPEEPVESTPEIREDALIEAARLIELGNIEQAESKYAEAERCYHGALEIFQKHGDRAGEGEATGNLGSVYHHRGQHDRAIERLIRAIDIARETGDQRSKGINLSKLALVYQNQGQYDRAISYYTQAIDIAKEIGNKHSEGGHLGCLGIVYQNQGKHDRAAEHFTLAIDIAREIGNKSSEGIHLGNLGGVYREQGKHAQAAEYFTSAIEIAKEIGNKSNEGIQIGNLGNVYKEQGLLDRAAEHFTLAIDIAREIGNKSNEGINLGNLGITHQDQGQYDRAAEHFTQAITIAREIGDKRTEGSHLGNLGDIFVKMEQLSDAEKAFRKAIPILDETFFIAAGAFRGSLALLLAQTDQFDEAQALLEVGEPQVATYPSEYAKFLCKKSQVQLLAGEPEAAQSFLDQAKAIASEYKFGDDGEVVKAIAELAALLHSWEEPVDEEREDALLEAARLLELGRIERLEGNYLEAERCYLSAIKAFQKNGDRTGEGEAHGHLGSVFHDQGKLDQATKQITQAIDIARETGNAQSEGIALGTLGNLYQRKGELSSAAALFTQAIYIAREIGDKILEGNTLGSLGSVYQNKGEADRASAHYTQAIEIARAIGDKRREGIYLGNLASVYAHKGELDRAIEIYTQTLEIARAIGNKRGEGIHLGNLGDILFQQHRFEKAEDAFREAIAISDEACPPAAGAFRGSLALLLSQKGQRDEVQSLLESGKSQVEAYPSEHAKFLCKKGQTQCLSDKPEAAQASLDQAKALIISHKLESDSDVKTAIGALEALLESPETAVQRSGDHHKNASIDAAQEALNQAKASATQYKFKDDGAVAQAVRRLSAQLSEFDTQDESPDKGREEDLIEAQRSVEFGRVEEAESNYPQAERCFLSAIELFQKHGDHAELGETLQVLGNVHLNNGKPDEAAAHYILATDLARAVGNKRSEGALLGNLGNVHIGKGNLDSAAMLLTQAIDLAHELGDTMVEGHHLGNLGIVYLNKGILDRAAQFFTQSIGIAREVGAKRNECTNLNNLGDVYRKKGEMDRAGELYNQAIDIARKIGNKRNECSNLSALGDILFQQNRLEEAEDSFRKAIPIADKAFPIVAGECRASLALILAQKGQDEEVQELLKIGETQVVTYPSIHANFLCMKGEVQLLGGEPESAQESLDQAKAVVAKHNLGDDAEATQAISALEEMLGSLGRPGESSDEAREDALIEAARWMELGNIEAAESKYTDAERCYLSAIEVFQKHGDRAGKGDALGQLGTLYRHMGELDQAAEHLKQAIHIARDIGNKQGEGINLGGLALIYHDQSELNRAIELYTEVIDIAREVGDKVLEGNTLGSLGTVFNSKGDHDRAIEHMNQSLEIAREIGDRRREDLNLGNMGLVHLNKGDTDQAIAHYTQALRIAMEIGDKRNVGNNLGNLGKAYERKGETDQALQYYNQAIDIAREIGNKRGEGLHLGNLGKILCQENRIREAEDALREAISIGELSFPASVNMFHSALAQLLEKKGQVECLSEPAKTAQEVGEGETLIQSAGPVSPSPAEEREDILIEANRLLALGQIEDEEAKYPAAESCYLSAIKIFEQQGDRTGKGEALGHLGNVYINKGEIDRAGELFTQAIDIAREMGDKETESINLGNIGSISLNRGELDRAAALFTQALDIAREIGNEHSVGIHLGNLGNIYRQQGDLNRGRSHYIQALNIARKFGNKRGEGSTLANLGSTYHLKGELDLADSHYTQALKIAREIGNKRSETLTLGSLGIVYSNKGELDRAAAHHTQALDIAREIGDKQNEGINLGNLGDILFQQQRLEEAEDAYRKAIPISDEACPPAAGAFRGSLAQLLAQKDQYEEAQELLKIGEPQVRPFRNEHVKFLCKKGQIQTLAGESQAAQEALDQAKSIATKHNLGADAEVAQAIGALADSVSGTD